MPSRKKQPPTATPPDARLARVDALSFEGLVSAIQQTHAALVEQATKAVNISLTVRNCLIGYYIQEYEQSGADRAAYGARLLETLAERLKERLDKCYTGRYLGLCRQFHEAYPRIRKSLISESGTAGMWKSLISELPANDVDKVPESAPLAELEIPVKHLLERLSFTHFIELMKCGDPLERVFYEVECIRGNWSVRELKRQIATQYFERSGQWRSWEAEMSEREKHAGWVYPEAHESPKGVTQRSDASAHGDVGLRPSVVSVLNHEAANPIYEIEVCEQFGGSAELENAIKTNLKGLGYGE